MPKVTLRHPVLKKTTTVSARQAAVLKASGWVENKPAPKQSAVKAAATDTTEEN